MSEFLKTLLALVGPLLGKLLKQWIDQLLNRVSKKVELTGDAVADTNTLFALALKNTPRRQLFRRALLYRLQATVPAAMADGKFTADEVNEIKNLVAGAKTETD